MLSDQEFAETVLTYLRSTRQEAHTRLRPDDDDATILKPCSLHQRKAMMRAREKRLRKMKKDR